jgi:methyltransferase (TIGR00027 family)
MCKIEEAEDDMTISGCIVRTARVAAAAWLCGSQPVLAVPQGQISYTAEVVCAFRAIAAQHPDPKLRNPDGLAAKLCDGTTQLPRTYASARSYIGSDEGYASYFYVNARTHYIDDALGRAAAGGATQVVVLGAGFDSRAYRFRRSHPGLKFFEVDLPATIEAKKTRLAAIFGAVPDYVRFAPIDFNSQKLEEVLPPLGYDARQRTFFILEGVLMYVSESGNGATLGFIRNHSAPGSRVVYDYVLRRVIEGKYGNLHAAGATAFGVARRGEPYVSGWTPREAAAFAKQHGLQVVEDVDAKTLTRRHLLGSDGKPDGKMIDWHRIIEAKVP